MFFGQSLLSARGSETALPDKQTAPVAAQPILVAARAVAAGAMVKSGDLVWRDWPTSGIDPAYIRRTGNDNLAAYTARVARTDIQSGEPISLARLAVRGAGGGLAAVTSPGQRAISVAVTPTSGISGLIVPGDRVDVILTYALPRGPDPSAGSGVERRAATTILSDLKVLAVDQYLSGRPAEGKAFQNVSLEVTVKQSEMLALAADLGKLSLSLLSSGTIADVGKATAGTSTIDYQVGRLLPSFGGRAPGPPRKVRGARLTQAVTEFHGNKRNGAEPTR